MPISAKRPCRYHGCAALTESGYCETHKRMAPKRDHGSSGVRKTGRQGVKDRERIKRRDNGLCQHCLEQGRLTEGTQVDHIVPLSDGGEDVDSNKQLLCSPCHRKKSAAEASRRGRGVSNL